MTAYLHSLTTIENIYEDIMQAVLGIVFHFIGGFASGSFYLPFNKVRNWSWDSYWLVGGIFSWLIVHPLAAALTVPAFASVISIAPPSVIGLTYLMGILWGV